MPIEVLVVVGALVLANLYWFFITFLKSGKYETTKQNVRNEPLTMSTSARNGDWVKVQGRVAALHKPLLSPINLIPCVYYHVVIRRLYVDEDGCEEWDELVCETSEQHFELIDMGGKMIIEPKESEFIEAKGQLYTRCYSSSDFEPEFLKRHDAQLVFSGHIEFYEQLIFEDDLLLVAGRGEQIRLEGGELRLCLRHQERSLLQISNAPSLLT